MQETINMLNGLKCERTAQRLQWAFNYCKAHNLHTLAQVQEHSKTVTDTNVRNALNELVGAMCAMGKTEL